MEAVGFVRGLPRLQSGKKSGDGAREEDTSDTMKPSDYPDAMRAVFETFSEETRIPLRLVSQIQSQQAAVFVEHFETWELVVVIRWIISRVEAQEQGRERTGMNRQSLQWHCIFGGDGDLNLAPFQQKLGLAMQWAQRAARALLPESAAPATVAKQAAQIHKHSPAARQLSPDEAAEMLRRAKEEAGL